MQDNFTPINIDEGRTSFAFSIGKSQHRKIMRIAKEHGVTAAEVVRQMVDYALERYVKTSDEDKK